MNFQQDVIERSFHIPVVVDFWAPWCGPCRVLGPVIEKLAEEQKDRWELVKINTEEHEALSRQYDIMSIPNVKMFYRGEVRHEFLGALPRQKIQEWLQKVLPGKGLMALDQLLNDKPNPEIADLEALLKEYPDSEEIAFVLSQIFLWEHPEQAKQLVSGIKMESPFFQKAGNIKDIADFLVAEDEDGEMNDIRTLLRSADLDKALPAWIDLISRKNIASGSGTAKAITGIFNLIGHNHPLSKEHRKKLDMSLWK